MKATHRAYAHARDRLLGAQAELAEATEALRIAEEAVRHEFDLAWQANQQAVQDADEILDAARQELLNVETTVNAAMQDRYRKVGGQGLVFPLADEQDRLDTVAEKVQAAVDACVQAREQFKAGVTAEQLAAVSES